MIQVLRRGPGNPDRGGSDGPSPERGGPSGRLRLLLQIVRVCAFLAAGALAGPTPLGADDLASALSAAPYSTAQKEMLRALFVRAEAQSVPSGLLLPRLREAEAKRVGADRAARAIERELDWLVQARSILMESDSGRGLLRDESSWARAANLLAAGMSGEEVRGLSLLFRQRPGDFRPGSWLYASLRQWGLDAESGQALLQSLLASRLPGDAFAGVPDLLQEGRRQRVAPEEMVRRMTAELPRSSSLEDLRERVLSIQEGER